MVVVYVRMRRAQPGTPGFVMQPRLQARDIKARLSTIPGNPYTMPSPLSAAAVAAAAVVVVVVVVIAVALRIHINTRTHDTVNYVHIFYNNIITILFLSLYYLCYVNINLARYAVFSV